MDSSKNIEIESDPKNDEKELSKRLALHGFEFGLLASQYPRLTESSKIPPQVVLESLFRQDNFVNRQEGATAEKSYSANIAPSDTLKNLERQILDILQFWSKDYPDNPKKKKEVLENLGQYIGHSSFSSDSIAIIANGYEGASLKTVNRVKNILNAAAYNTSDNDIYLKSIFAIAPPSSGNGIIVNRPFEKRYINKKDESGNPPTSTILPDGTFLIVASVVGIDEKFTNGDPQPVGDAVFIFRPNGESYCIPVPDIKNKDQTFGLDGDGFIFATYDKKNNSIDLADIKVDQSGVDIEKRTIDFKNIQKLLGVEDVHLWRVVKHEQQNGETNYYWEVGVAGESKIVKQTIDPNGDRFIVYGEVNNQYQMLGRVGGALSLLETDGKTYNIVFVDGYGRNHKRSFGANFDDVPFGLPLTLSTSRLISNHTLSLYINYPDNDQDGVLENPLFTIKIDESLFKKISK